MPQSVVSAGTLALYKSHLTSHIALSHPCGVTINHTSAPYPHD